MRTVEQIEASLRRRAAYKLVAIGVLLVGLGVGTLWGAVEGARWAWHRLSSPVQVVQVASKAEGPRLGPVQEPIRTYVVNVAPCRDRRGHFARCPRGVDPGSEGVRCRHRRPPPPVE